MQRINTNYIGSIAKHLNLAVQFPKNCIVLWKSAQKLSQLFNFGAFWHLYYGLLEKMLWTIQERHIHTQTCIYLLER